MKEMKFLFLAILATASQVSGMPRASVLVHPDSQKDTLDSISGSSSFPEDYAVLQHVPGPPSEEKEVKSLQSLPRHSGKIRSKKAMFVSSMAFITGFVDVICYRRYGCFVNMMTGNTIRFATALAESRLKDAFFYVSLISSYAIGVGMFRVMDLKMRHGNDTKMTGESPLQILTTVAPVVAVLFVLADAVSHFFANNRIHAPLLSMGFGLTNAATADATGGTILYAMTGHITKAAHSFVDYWMLSKPKALKSVRSHSRIVTCFAAGIFLSIKASQYVLPITQGLKIPMATTAGTLFCMLFLWYGSTPKSFPPIM